MEVPEPSRNPIVAGRNALRAGGGRGWIGLIAPLILWLGAMPCLAAQPYTPVFGDPLLEPWRWHSFPELSGLGAHCMAEGADGTIWIGAIEGMWSFDGTQWVHYPNVGEIGATVTLCRGPDGKMYAGGRGGIGQFQQGTWTQVFPPRGRNLGDTRKLTSAADGSMWAATSWGALRFRQGAWTLFTDPGTVERLRSQGATSFVQLESIPEAVLNRPRPASARTARRCEFAEVAIDRQGQVWLGSATGEIFRYAPPSDPAGEGSWSLFSESDGIVSGVRPCILPLQDGSVWVAYGAQSGHLNVFDGRAWKATPLADSGVAGDCGSAIQSRDGVVWLSGRYTLAACRQGRWHHYTKPAVPIPYATNFLLQTADGALWIAGTGTEILRLDYQTSRWLTLRDLNFQWESPTGAQWFLHREGRIVVQQDNRWTSYGVEDGVIDKPVALIGTRSGDVWVAGSHLESAATSRFSGQKWTRYLHDEFAWGIDWRAVYEARDGSVWFGAAVDSSGPPEHRDGILQFRDGQWLHHHQPGRAFKAGSDEDPQTLLPATQRPEPIGKYLLLGESRDGKLWAGRNVLVYRESGTWNRFVPPPELRFGIIETMLTTGAGELWLGTRQFGALRYDGANWTQHQGKGSLVANSVRNLAETTDGTIWAATDRGVSRFDGQSWSAEVLPAEFTIPLEGGGLRASASGALWVNHCARDWYLRGWSKATRVNTAECEFWTACHQFRGPPPQTVITAGADVVSHPGNLSVFWNGTAPWRDARNSQLQFSFRLDDQPWSPFTSEQGHSFFTLPAGKHRIEVRSRDRDFNVDPVPAVLAVTVLPPVWRQTWFLAVITLLSGGVATQTVRVLRERGRLRKANRELADEMEERRLAQQDVALKSFALNNVHEAAFLVDEHARLHFVNEESCRMLGYTRDELLTMSVGDVDPAYPSDRWPSHWIELKLRRSLVFESVQRTRDGRIIPVEINANYFEYGGRGYNLALVRNIAERKRAEREHAEHLAFLESMDRINRAIQGTSDLEQMTRDALDVVMEVFAVDRAFLLYPCDPDAPEWSSPMERNKPEYPGIGIMGLRVPMDPDVARTFRILLHANGPVRFGPGGEHPLPREVSDRFSIKTFMSMALYPKVGRPWQFGIHQCSHARTWTSEEQRLFLEIGRRLADALTSLLIVRDLREGERKLAEAERIGHLGYWEFDPATDAFTVSEESGRILGLPPDVRCISRGELKAAVHPADWDDLHAAAKAALARGPRFSKQYRVVQSSGLVRFVHSQGDVTNDAAGNPLRMFGTLQDVTEREQAEQELRRAKEDAEAANRAKDHFLAVLSHELRTPLTPVLLLASAMETNKTLPAGIRDDVATIRSNVQAEARLIDDLLDLTRVAHNKLSLRLEPTDVHAVLLHVIDVYRKITRQRGHELRFELGARRATVSCDAQRLQQVFKNLIDNALKYTPASGTISLRTRNLMRSQAVDPSGTCVAVDALPAVAGSAADQELLAIEVSDTGVGISADALPSIFEPFEQPHRTLDQGVGGLGLGLTIARGIVAAHHGAMRVYSEGPGKGSTFILQFAVATDSEPPLDALPRRASTPAPPQAAGARRVLLVEDHEITARSLARVMGSAGFDVTTAGTIADAMEHLAVGRFDVLLSDLGLPDGDGTAVMQHIRQRSLPTRGIALTGFGQESDRQRALDAGFDMHLIKPITMEQLFDALASLERSGAPAPPPAQDVAPAP